MVHGIILYQVKQYVFFGKKSTISQLPFSGKYLVTFTNHNYDNTFDSYRVAKRYLKRCNRKGIF